MKSRNKSRMRTEFDVKNQAIINSNSNITLVSEKNDAYYLIDKNDPLGSREKDYHINIHQKKLQMIMSKEPKIQGNKLLGELPDYSDQVKKYK